MYLRVHAAAKAEFQKYVQSGSHFVNCNLLAIMSLLNPLRALCSGGALAAQACMAPSLHSYMRTPLLGANDQC